MRSRATVVATNLPIGDNGRFAERCIVHRSYIVASPDDGTALDATFISAGEPMRLILTACVDGAEYVLVGGEGHSLPGRGASAERFARLAAYAAERLGARESTHRWSTQDCVPIDGLPFAGPIAPDAKAVYAITGLRKWGLSNGTAAALVVADAVCGLASPWARLFDSNRAVPLPRRSGSVMEKQESPQLGVTVRTCRGNR